MSPGPPQSGQGGFALVMVVFLLFAVAVAGATGYQVVSSEFALARQNREGQEALAVARAGLQRFLGETVGLVGDSVSYAIGNGIATVTTRKIFQKDTLNHLYHIRSEGLVDDPRTPLLSARRTVDAYAWHRLNPIPLKGSVWVSGGTTTFSNPFLSTTTITGFDAATTADCSGGGTAGVRAVVKGAGGVSGVGPTGPAPTTVTYAGLTAFKDTVNVRWDILSNASFPVDFQGAYPSWGSLPADSFPVIRFNGNHTTGSASGRGVLIVTGTLTMSSFFSWDGIILAGAVANVGSFAYPSVRGMLIAGMNASNSNVTLRGSYAYHSCNAYKANKALSYLELVDNALFEING